MKYSRLLLIICFFAVELNAQQEWQSNILKYGTDGKLVYTSDSEGNKIPDFSYAGYKGGGVEIPEISVVKTIEPISGDNTSHIQAAINETAQLSVDANGFRGAILLKAGLYEVNGTIKVNQSGIILRGEGDGDDPAVNTILYGKGNTPNQRTIIIAGGGSSSKWQDQVSGTKVFISSDTVYVGSRTFEIDDVSKFNIGDNIIIYHPCTDAWLASVDYGGSHYTDPGAEAGVDVPWKVDAWPIVFNRYITDIKNNQITIDAPVFNTLIKSLSNSYIYKYGRSGLKTNIGIENLRIDIETTGGEDEKHAWQAIDLYRIEDSWVKDCTMLHFGQSGVRCNTASRITVQDCNALDPVSIITGERRYNFNVYTASQQILFIRCHATNGRHHYVSNGTSWTSGCAFVDCTSQGSWTSSEGHRSWSMGLLYDNVIELDGPRSGVNPRLLGLYNRGYYGTSHGWAAAHSVAWNCDVAKGDLIVQKPPTAQNYAIGCKGANVTGKTPPAPFKELEGYIEGTNKENLNPRSLYSAQLIERLARPVSIQREETENLPTEYVLYQNYPNPFNPTTTIKFTIPSNAGYQKVSLYIYDALGSEITLLNEENNPGNYEIVFNASKLSSGVYFYRLVTPQYSLSKKMILLK